MFCHFRISIAGSPPQTVVFQLNPDKCPTTCDNFIALCQSSATAKRPSSSSTASSSTHDVVQPTYRGTDFHRILPGFMIQGGDFTKFDGSGGYAAPSTNKGQTTFPDENFDISHDREGILSMANRGKNTNGSQFFITLGKTLHLDGKHVAFGHVVRGVEVVREVSKVETEGDNGRPVMLQRVVIVDCGLGTGDDGDSDSGSSSSSSSSESSSLENRRKRSSSKKKHRRRKDEEDEASHKKRKRSRDRSSRSKNRKRRDKDDCSRDHKHRKHSKDKSSHRHRSRNYSSSSEEGERHGHSSEKRHKSDRRSDDRHHRKKKSDRK
mmetsp:Transcript_10657/g.19263  ORF Transcript_10657/g.19263 Transcript_10657/m.19263 type:complete len:322 (-) Transcript_10657:1147-2112(-)